MTSTEVEIPAIEAGRRGRPDWLIGAVLAATLVTAGVVFVAGVFGAASVVGAAILASLSREELPPTVRRWQVKREARRADKAARREGRG